MNPPIPPKLTKSGNPVFSLIESRTKDLDPSLWSYKLAGGSYGLDTIVGNDLDVNESLMSLRFPFADGSNRDGVGDKLAVLGIDLSRHRRNPLWAWDHFKNITLPIGQTEYPDTRMYTVELDPVANVAWATGFMYQGKGLAGIDKEKEYDHALFCSQLFDMLVKRFIRGFSIGYTVQKAEQLPPDYSTGTPQGLDLQNILMLECSATSIPANPLTVRKSFRSDDDFHTWQEGITSLVCVGNCCGKTLSPVLTKSLSPYVLQRKAQMSVPSSYKDDCHCNGTCDKCKEEKSMEVKGLEDDFRNKVLNTALSWVRSGLPGNDNPTTDQIVDYMMQNSTMGPKVETWLRQELRKTTGKSLGVKSVPATIKEGTRVVYDDEEGTVVYTNELDRKAGFVKVQIDGESSPRNMNQSSLQVKSLPSYTQLTTNQTAVPYTPPPKTGQERQMQAELGDAMTSNPQNLLVSDGSNPGPTTGSISWAKVKRLRKNIRMKRGKTITGIKSMQVTATSDTTSSDGYRIRSGESFEARWQDRNTLLLKMGGNWVKVPADNFSVTSQKAMSALRAGAGAELVGAKDLCPDCANNPCTCMRDTNTTKKLKGIKAKRPASFRVGQKVENTYAGSGNPYMEGEILEIKDASTRGSRDKFGDWSPGDVDYRYRVRFVNGKEGWANEGDLEAKSLNGKQKNGLSPLTPVPKVHAAQRSYYDRVLNAAADDDVNAGNLKALRMKYRQKARRVGEGNPMVGYMQDMRPQRFAVWYTITSPRYPNGDQKVDSFRSKEEAENFMRELRGRGKQPAATGGFVEYSNIRLEESKSLPAHETKGWGNWLHAIAAVLATLIGDPGLANINLELMGDDLGLDDLYGEGKTPQQAAEVIKPKVRKKMLEVRTKVSPNMEIDGKPAVYFAAEGEVVPHFAMPESVVREIENQIASGARSGQVNNRSRSWTWRMKAITKSIEAVMFDAWGTENYNTPLENRKINVRENGSEREITFGQLISMVGHGEAERLWRMAIRKGTGKWHAASESYSPNPREYKSGKVPGNPLMGKFDSFIEQWEAMSPANRVPLLQGAGLSANLANRDWTGMDRVEQATLLRTHAKGTKSLPDIRMKYRATKRYKKTIRSAKKGTYAFNIHEKDLTSMRADAKAAGCKASWSGGDGSSIRVKLTGSDDAIDGIARKFARRGR